MLYQCPYCLEAFGSIEACNEHIKDCKKRPVEVPEEVKIKRSNPRKK